MFLQIRIEIVKRKKQDPIDMGVSLGTIQTLIGLGIICGVLCIIAIIPSKGDPEMISLKFHTFVTFVLQNVIPSLIILRNGNLTKYAVRKFLSFNFKSPRSASAAVLPV